MYYYRRSGMDIRLYTFLPCLLALAYARGPHHPRGERVVRRHTHYKPSKEAAQKLTEDVQLLHDIEHIQEHLDGVIEEPDLSKMTEEELEFYYFQVHDSDKNSKLDGLEILQAIFHTGQHDEQDYYGDSVPSEESSEAKVDDFSYYVELIDQVLSEDDLNDDGFLSYSEYIAGRRKTKEGHNIREPIVKMIA